MTYFENNEDITPLKWNVDYSRYTPGKSDVLTINLDDSGSGTFYDYYKYEEPVDVTVETTETTRTNTGMSIVVSDSYIRTNSGAGVRTDNKYITETKAVSQQIRTQTATFNFSSQHLTLVSRMGNQSQTVTDASYRIDGMRTKSRLETVE